MENRREEEEMRDRAKGLEKRERKFRVKALEEERFEERRFRAKAVEEERFRQEEEMRNKAEVKDDDEFFDTVEEMEAKVGDEKVLQVGIVLWSDKDDMEDDDDNTLDEDEVLSEIIHENR